MKRSPLKRRTPLRRRGESRDDAIWRECRTDRLERDDFTCQAWERDLFDHDCTIHDRLEVHHIRRRSQGGTHELANLVTLCSAAHAWVHLHPADAHELGLLARGAA